MSNATSHGLDETVVVSATTTQSEAFLIERHCRNDDRTDFIWIDAVDPNRCSESMSIPCEFSIGQTMQATGFHRPVVPVDQRHGHVARQSVLQKRADIHLHRHGYEGEDESVQLVRTVGQSSTEIHGGQRTFLI